MSRVPDLEVLSRKHGLRMCSVAQIIEHRLARESLVKRIEPVAGSPRIRVRVRPRFDYAVRLEGPTLSQVHHAVRRMWEIVSWVNFKRRFRLSTPVATFCDDAGHQAAAFLIRDNIRHRHDILNAYLEAIDSAQREILIANAYFLPGVRFGRALQAAARRGVVDPDRGRLAVYPCGQCGGYHVGHRKIGARS